MIIRFYTWIQILYLRDLYNRFIQIYTDSIYSKLSMTHEKYIEILNNNKHLFSKQLGSMESEFLDNSIQEAIFLCSKCHSYICKCDISDNDFKQKNNILHTKGILNSYSQQFIDHNIFKKALINNDKPDKIKFNITSLKNQRLTTKNVDKYNIEFFNDKRYIKDIYSNKPHTLKIE